MACTKCVTPDCAISTIPNPDVDLPFLTFIPAHISTDTGRRHEEAYTRGEACACGADLWRPRFSIHLHGQAGWTCVPCLRKAAARAYSRKAGTPERRKALAEAKRDKRAKAALHTFLSTPPKTPLTPAERAALTARLAKA